MCCQPCHGYIRDSLNCESSSHMSWLSFLSNTSTNFEAAAMCAWFAWVLNACYAFFAGGLAVWHNTITTTKTAPLRFIRSAVQPSAEITKWCAANYLASNFWWTPTTCLLYFNVLPRAVYLFLAICARMQQQLWFVQGRHHTQDSHKKERQLERQTDVLRTRQVVNTQNCNSTKFPTSQSLTNYFLLSTTNTQCLKTVTTVLTNCYNWYDAS